MRYATFVALGCAAAMAGCGDVAPTVKYQVVTGPDLNGLTKFSFQSSLITVDLAKDKNGNPLKDENGNQAYAATSIPAVDPSGVIYSIEPVNSLGVDTTIKMTPQANTTLISSVGTTVVDNRVKDIQTVATIVSAALPLVAAFVPGPAAPPGAAVVAPLAAGPPPTFPAVIDVSRIHLPKGKDDGTVETIKGKFNGDNGLNYTIVYSAVPADAKPLEGYPFGTSQKVLPYAACRNATISFTISGVPEVLSVTFADPNFLETIALPASGAVTMDSSCGVSVTTQTATTSSTLDVISALVSAANTIRNAESSKPATTATK